MWLVTSFAHNGLASSLNGEVVMVLRAEKRIG